MCSASRFDYGAIAPIARPGGDCGASTVVPVHAGETIGPGLLRQILSDVEMEPRDFEEWL